MNYRNIKGLNICHPMFYVHIYYLKIKKDFKIFLVVFG